MKQVDIDPKSIDLKEAYCMCSHAREYFAPENEGRPLTYKSDGFPLIIDFDELDKIEPPAGYALNKAHRNIEIRISTFNGYCPGAKHYYCNIKFEGPTLRDVAYEIVERIFDYSCCGISDLIVGDKTVKVQYEYRCSGEYGHESVCVPIEWFDEGFDYRSAYKEMKRKEAEEEKKKRLEAERKRKAKAKIDAEAHNKKEYETYLKLKQKYEPKT